MGEFNKNEVPELPPELLAQVKEAGARLRARREREEAGLPKWEQPSERLAWMLDLATLVGDLVWGTRAMNAVLQGSETERARCLETFDEWMAEAGDILIRRMNDEDRKFLMLEPEVDGARVALLRWVFRQNILQDEANQFLFLSYPGEEEPIHHYVYLSMPKLVRDPVFIVVVPPGKSASIRTAEWVLRFDYGFAMRLTHRGHRGALFEMKEWQPGERGRPAIDSDTPEEWR